MHSFNAVVALMGMGVLWTCSPPARSVDPTLDEAAQLVRAGKLSDAVEAVRASLGAGKERASRVLSDPAFRSLMGDPDHRAKVHEIISQNVRESELTMVCPSEPGPRLRVEGKVVNQSDGSPRAGVVVYFYQTDAKGIYALIGGKDVGSVNPRLFGFVKTDSAGRFVVNTIVPASYPGTTALRHIHWEIRQAGRQGVFLFDDDPFLTPASRIKEEKYLQRVREEKGVKVIAPVIKL